MTTVDASAGVRLRLLDGPDDGRLDTHLGRHGRPPVLDAGRLVELLRAAGLTGRGGAGFPTWRKVEAVLRAGGSPVVVANAAEGEPASGKDRVLLAYRPHLVLDGLQLVAGALGVRTAHLYVAATSADGVRAALAARRGAGLDRVPVTVTIAPAAFIAGEESAVVAAVSGRPAVPADKLPRITDSGVGGAPTLVQNVETLAHLALIARHGPGWFRTAGTTDEPGTFLTTIGGAVSAPGVIEAGYGIRLGDLINAAGGPAAPLQAVLLGGYHGGWVPARPELAVSRAALAPFGASPGAGVVLALPAHVCGLAETARIAGYLADAVSGQCGPCINGLPRLASTLGDLARHRVRPRPAAEVGDLAHYPVRPGLPGGVGDFAHHGVWPGLPAEVGDLAHPRARPGLAAEVERLAALVTGRGACRHPDGTARMIRSAMRLFEADVAAHLAGHCLAEGVRR